MRRDLCFFLVVVGSLLTNHPASAFDEQVTHPALTRAITRSSSLDGVLRNEIGLRDGTATLVGIAVSSRQTISEWFQDGSRFEDDPPCRASHHFHNPLKPFTTSGVTNQAFVVRLGCSNSGFLPPRSSVTWGTGFTSPTVRGPATGNPFDWDAARVAFLNGLTLETPDAREAELARTFEALGHLLHLVQDLAVPAHVRNDFPAHEGFFPQPTLNVTRWFQEPFERFMRRNESLIAEAAAWAEKLDFVGQLVTRFWDTDRYTGATPTADLLQGLAEYTNANFASPNTIFTEDLDPSNEFAFPYPRRSSTNFDLVTSKDDRLVQFVTAEDGREDRVLYLAKTGDGELIGRFLRLGFFTGDVLDKAPPGTPAKLLVQIDDDVHRAYAAKLLPRAIGYGAGLLDYFFRGKLDVDLFSDDGSTLQVRGTNASPDPLVEGTLKLYADVPTLDPEGRPTTVRRELAALGDTNVRGVDPGQALSSALFQPQEAERFVAVYQGRLGNEIPVPNPDTPSLSFPGGVIGKVLGGVRVEEVFSDDNGQWMLRSPIGVFALHDETGPLTTARFRDLRWGDGPDHLLARTFGGLQQVPRFAAYRVPRQPNSVEPVTQVLAGVTIIRLAPLVPETAFPAIAPVLTTVTLTEVIDYRQQLVMADRIMVRQWRPIFPDLPENDGTNYPLTGFAPGAVTVQTVNEQQFRFTDTVPIVLDLDHSAYTATASDPDRLSYAWHVEDVGLTADGHIIAVVKVTLHPPFLSFQPRLTQPVYGLDEQGNQVVAETCTFFSGCQPREITLFRSYPSEVFPLLWAVVDVTTGQVLATTAEPALTIATHQIAAPPTLVYFHLFERRVGGPRPTTQDLPRNWTETGTRAWDGQPAATTTDLTLLAGEPRAVGGWYRRELRDALTNAGLLGPAGAPQNRSVTLAFGDLGPNQQLLVFHFPPTPPAELRPRLGFAVRARRAPGGERLVFLVDGFLIGQGTIQAVAAWDAVAQEARVAFTQRGSGESGIEIVDAAGNLALVGQFAFERGYVIALDGTAPVRVFEDPGALVGFRLLDPQHLYNVDVQRFFRLDPPLQATPLPARLTTLDPNPVFGDYHAIRLP